MNSYPRCVSTLDRSCDHTSKLPASHHFDLEHGAPRPISFLKVADQSVACTSSLFSLPTELIDNITQYLSPCTLDALALTSRCGLQLSRSLRVQDIRLDYSLKSHRLLAQLSCEADEVIQDPSTPHLPPLGYCIRRLCIHTFVKNIETWHDINIRDYKQSSSSKSTLDDINKAYFDQYLPLIQRVIMTALPNLEVVMFEDKVRLPRSFASSIPAWPANRLSLKSQLEHESYGANISDHPFGKSEQSCPLQYLSLNKFEQSSSFWNLLHRHSNTLEELRLSDISVRTTGDPEAALSGLGPEQAEPTERQLHFSKLRTLQVVNTSFPDSREFISNLILSARSTIIKLRVHLDLLGSCNRTTIPSLRTLVIEGIYWKEEDLSFLHANPQVTKLSFQEYVGNDLMVDFLLPMLCTNFLSLRSLELRPCNTTKTMIALHSLSNLDHLHQLSLKAHNYTWSSSWYPNHVAVRAALRGIKSLRKLVFQHDQYSPGTEREDCVDLDAYQEGTEWFGVNEPHSSNTAADQSSDAGLLAKTRESLLLADLSNTERVQVLRLCHDVVAYRQALPGLEWLYLDGTAFDLSRDVDDSVVVELDTEFTLGDLSVFTE